MRGAIKLGAASSARGRPNPANASLRESDVPVSRPKTPFRKRFSSMVNLSCGIAALLEPRRAVFVSLRHFMQEPTLRQPGWRGRAPLRPFPLLVPSVDAEGAVMAAMLTRSIITSGVASAATAVALMLLGRYERRGALMPLNASSHWVYGDRAAQREADLARTGLG